MAKKVKSQARPKEQAQLKEQAQKFLAKVPEEHIFRCYDGSAFRDMKELAESLAAMSDDVFAHHVNSENNDFCNWVRDVIEDDELASELVAATTRLQAVGCVNSRLALLTGSLT